MDTRETKENAREDMIRKYAQEFVRNGYQVWARSSGFRQPIPIDGYIPDIIAKLGTNIKIVQIETYHPPFMGSSATTTLQYYE